MVKKPTDWMDIKFLISFILKKQLISFIGFLILLYAIKGSPIDFMSHMMVTMHMVQMAFLLLVLPILFIKGMLDRLWRMILDRPMIRGIFDFFTKPIVALLLFNVAFSVYHLPIDLDFSKTSIWINTLSLRTIKRKPWKKQKSLWTITIIVKRINKIRN